MIIKYVFGVAIVMVMQISCSLEYPDGYFERIKEFEKNWGICYEDRFSFPKNDTIKGLEYLKCNLDGKDILINDQKDGYEGGVLYTFSGITNQPNIILDGNNVLQYGIDIAMFDIKYFKEFAIIIKYPHDSLNYTIQKTFSKSKIVCSTNFVDNGAEFMVGTSCTPNGGVRFSTLYSLKEDQSIRIDSFNYQLTFGVWHYHLEYSFDTLEITNEVWNENKKIDILGKTRKSDIFVENLLIKDMKSVIEFELPDD